QCYTTHLLSDGTKRKKQLILYTLLFLGAVLVGIYTVVVTLVGEGFSNGEWVSVYTVLSVAWGIDAFGEAAMALNTHGLPLMATLLCGLFSP
ncbi:hypothetical protein ACTVLV_23805, partial [Serratia bockelmannii]